MSAVRVLIVEDSRVVREYLTHIIGRDPRLEVAAAVSCGEEALRVLNRIAPDVVSLDIRLPGIDGFETTRRIMAERPTPIVVVSGSVEAEDLKISMNALRAGALTVVEKPAGTLREDFEAMAERLCTQLVIMSRVKVIRQRPAIRTAAAASSRRVSAPSPPPVKVPPGRCFTLVALAASTGGPAALEIILRALGEGFPLPVLVVQHITPAFHTGFVAWLDGIAPQPVCAAAGGTRVVPGHVYVAPPEHHLVVRGGLLGFDGSEPVSNQRPSATVLFEALAASLGPATVGVVLTGMGDDGARGLLALRRAGGYTLVEDASTAVVNGMPAAADALGAACEVLPLDGIGPRLCELVETGGRRT